MDSSQLSVLPASSDTSQEFLTEFIHVIQFCHLCAKGKITPVLYTLATTSAIQIWYSSLSASCKIDIRTQPKRSTSAELHEADGNEVSSPEHKISRKDHYFINTMLKLHDTLHKSHLKATTEKEEREPGFTCLESHQKNLILNASMIPPFDVQATQPTEFYNIFLSKKSQFKAKEMMSHSFYLDKIAFNPSTLFIANIWNCDFFWIYDDLLFMAL